MLRQMQFSPFGCICFVCGFCVSTSLSLFRFLSLIRYLNIDGVKVLPVHKLVLLAMWSLDGNVGAVDADEHVGKPCIP